VSEQGRRPGMRTDPPDRGRDLKIALLIAVGAIVFVFVVLLIAFLVNFDCYMSQTGNCGSDGDSSPHFSVPPDLVVYEVRGPTSTGNVAYMAPDGYHQGQTLPVPWTASIRFDPGKRLWLVGHADEGPITCVISEDGEVLAISEPGRSCKVEATS
jgi:hypothetical protein